MIADKGGMYARQSAHMAVLRPSCTAWQQNRRNLEKVSSRKAARLFRQARRTQNASVFESFFM